MAVRLGVVSYKMGRNQRCALLHYPDHCSHLCSIAYETRLAEKFVCRLRARETGKAGKESYQCLGR